MLDFVKEVTTKPAIISAARTTLIVQTPEWEIVNISLLNASAHAVVHVTMLGPKALSGTLGTGYLGYQMNTKIMCRRSRL